MSIPNRGCEILHSAIAAHTEVVTVYIEVATAYTEAVTICKKISKSHTVLVQPT